MATWTRCGGLEPVNQARYLLNVGAAPQAVLLYDSEEQWIRYRFFA